MNWMSCIAYCYIYIYLTTDWNIWYKYLVVSFLLPLHQFVDLCILLGCDYCDKIAGFGPKRALTLIQKHRTIENVVLHINRQVLCCPIGLCFSFCMYHDKTDSCCPLDPSSARKLEVQRSTEVIFGCTRNQSSWSHLDWARWRSFGSVPHLLQTYMQVGTHGCILFSFYVTWFFVCFEDSYDCIYVVLFSGRPEFVSEWRGFEKCGRASGRRGRRSLQQDKAGRLAWKTFSELSERGSRWTFWVFLYYCHSH